MISTIHLQITANFLVSNFFQNENTATMISLILVYQDTFYKCLSYNSHVHRFPHKWDRSCCSKQLIVVVVILLLRFSAGCRTYFISWETYSQMTEKSWKPSFNGSNDEHSQLFWSPQNLFLVDNYQLSPNCFPFDAIAFPVTSIAKTNRIIVTVDIERHISF